MVHWVSEDSGVSAVGSLTISDWPPHPGLHHTRWPLRMLLRTTTTLTRLAEAYRDALVVSAQFGGEERRGAMVAMLTPEGRAAVEATLRALQATVATALDECAHLDDSISHAIHHDVDAVSVAVGHAVEALRVAAETLAEGSGHLAGGESDLKTIRESLSQAIHVVGEAGQGIADVDRRVVDLAASTLYPPTPRTEEIRTELSGA